MERLFFMKKNLQNRSLKEKCQEKMELPESNKFRFDSDYETGLTKSSLSPY